MTNGEIMLSIVVLICFAAALCANARAEREEKEKKKYKSICDRPIQFKAVNMRPARVSARVKVKRYLFEKEENIEILKKEVMNQIGWELMKHKELYLLREFDLPISDEIEMRADVFVLPVEEAKRAAFSILDEYLG